ncbi:telomere length regulation protein-domain-containing protein [Staphylotrichum tortipilum]|uniref:Telomere length regulation protein-domain-containing protein n=1 Tax=Staphylotrichum tortipilum TaxID=2831512 RepID=A0AAN6RVK1_9PEZI|nr:telomere length regulation protein-domain-containing protein [Staphylotrichum longicolle]
MDELLRPSSIVRTTKSEAEPGFLLELSTSAGNQHSIKERQPKPAHKTPTTPADALEILKTEPDYDSLISALAFLSRHEAPGSSLTSIKQPSPLSAQLVQVLVSEIVPNYWALLIEDADQPKTSALRLLLYCLSSITGVNAILVRLKALTAEAKSEAAAKARRPDIALGLGILLDLLCRLLQGDGWLLEAFRLATSGHDGPARARPRLQEIVATFGGGRIVSLAAEADEIVKSDAPSKQAGDIWPADSLQYTQWLGRNTAKLASDPSNDEAKATSDLFAKALRLGHPDALIKLLLSELVVTPRADPAVFGTLLGHLAQTEQRRVLFSVLKIFSAEHLDRLGRCESEDSKPLISAVAGALNGIRGSNDNATKHFVEWLTGSSGAGLGEGIGIRRAVLAAISQSKDNIVAVLEKSLAQFGDQLYIKHSPILQQEAHAQVLLLSAGYVHRKSPIKLAMLLRSSIWLNTISNRLRAPQQKARILGMVVGEALSGLVDKGDKRLNFKMEETDEEEGAWYKGLTEISDDIGPLDFLFKPRVDSPKRKRQPKLVQRPVTAQLPPTGFIIEELSDEEAPEEDDIVPYAKPDSDPEDSDEDATLVTRNKPKAPVYIRDLIKYLRDTESYDHQKLALTTTPTLIRRKADYGTEVSEHAEELASLLVGLSDKFELENFEELRVQGMIAIAVAKPEKMGQWFAKTFFDGDYSVSQRASILVVLGISARELAGFETSDYSAAAAFPSKTLPERVERLYISNNPAYTQPSSALKPLPPNALDNIVTSLTSAFLAPMAASAADAATGPDVLKLSTFSSRLEQSKETQDQQLHPNPKIKYTPHNKTRVRIIPNKTAHLLATFFFSPLTARFQAALHSSSRANQTILFHPHLLALYLKTLALLLHAAGPSTLALPQLTADFWRLLLGTAVRARAVGDLPVTQAVLFGFAALLDVNENRMREVCEELGREVVEAQEWVAGVFAGLRGGDEGGEEERVRVLAAGVLVRLREGVEKWRMVLVGDLIGFG